MFPAEQQWDAQAQGPDFGGASIKAQTCRRHVKTRAEETEKHQKHSAEVGKPRFAEVARQNSETWGRPRARDKEKQSTEHVKGSSV